MVRGEIRSSSLMLTMLPFLEINEVKHFTVKFLGFSFSYLHGEELEHLSMSFTKLSNR